MALINRSTMQDSNDRVILWILAELILMTTILKLTNAGDFLLVADSRNRTIYAGSMGLGLTDLAPLPLSEVEVPVAVDYDPGEEMIYWTDIDSLFPKICRAHLNGSKQKTLVEDLGQKDFVPNTEPEGLALDVDSRMMYWTDADFGHIARASMDGTGSKEIIVDELDHPRTIVIDHRLGHIYWTTVGDSPRIERADFDGQNRTTVAEKDLLVPNGVTVDFEENYLYWCDGEKDKIERSDLSGNNRKNISLPAFFPFDLVLYKNYLYWTNWFSDSIFRINVNGRQVKPFGPDVLKRATGIHIQEDRNYCDSSPCNNGSTCVDVVNGFSCQCSPGFQGTTCADKIVPVGTVVGGVMVLVLFIIALVTVLILKRLRPQERTVQIPRDASTPNHATMGSGSNTGPAKRHAHLFSRISNEASVLLPSCITQPRPPQPLPRLSQPPQIPPPTPPQSPPSSPSSPLPTQPASQLPEQLIEDQAIPMNDYMEVD